MNTTFTTKTITGNLATSCVFRGSKSVGSKMIVVASDNRSVQEWLYQYLDHYVSKGYFFCLVESEYDFSEYAGKPETVMVFIEDIFYGEKAIGKLDYYNKQYPKLQFVLFSASHLPFNEAARFINWSNGSYLSLRDSDDDIKESIKTVFEKRKSIPSYLKDDVIEYNSLTKVDPHLTHREIEILRYAINGNTAKETAAILMLSYRTIRNHISNIYNKFKIRNMAGVLRLAISKGILPIEIIKIISG